MNRCYQPKFYRDNLRKEKWSSFTVSHKETDFWLSIPQNDMQKGLPEYILARTIEIRKQLDSFIKDNPYFIEVLRPYPFTGDAPSIVRACLTAGELADVGPMAAIAGAFAQLVGEEAKKEFNLPNLIIENGGDIYATFTVPITISLYAGSSSLSCKIGVELAPFLSPLGICTSSGTVGHALSFGRADAVTVLAKDAAIADAFATKICNSIKTQEDIEKVLEHVAEFDDLKGVVIVMGDKVGIKGELKIVPLA